MHGESADDEIVSLLRQRDGIATEVILRDGKCCLVYDIAWGYDDGDTFAHITTNISPGGQGRSVDFFSRMTSPRSGTPPLVIRSMVTNDRDYLQADSGGHSSTRGLRDRLGRCRSRPN
jgi:hypothetical protein